MCAISKLEFIFRSLFLNNYLFQDALFGDMYSKMLVSVIIN